MRSPSPRSELCSAMPLLERRPAGVAMCPSIGHDVTCNRSRCSSSRTGSMRSITRAVWTAWLAEPTPSMWSGAGTPGSSRKMSDISRSRAGSRPPALRRGLWALRTAPTHGPDRRPPPALCTPPRFDMASQQHTYPPSGYKSRAPQSAHGRHACSSIAGRTSFVYAVTTW